MHRFLQFALSFFVTLAVIYAGNILINNVSENTAPQPNFEEVKKRCFQHNQPDAQCLSDRLGETTAGYGISAGFDLVSYLYETEPRFSQTCHDFVHQLGEAAYDKFSQNQDFGLSAKTAFCAYGFYHGFMETLLIKTGDFKKAREFCDYVDSQLSKQTQDAKLQCYHGIGHGTVGIHDPSIRGDEKKLIAPAMDLCEKVSETSDQLYRCASGIFNAIAIYYQTGEYELPLNKNDPLKVCREQKDIHKDSCFGNMNTLLMWLTDGDLEKAGRFVEGIDEDKYAISAIRYLSAAPIVNYIGIGNYEQLILDCRSLQNRLQLPCIEGIVHGLMEHGQPGVEYVEAFAFCRMSQLTGTERLKCFQHALPYLRSIYDEQKTKSICSQIEPQYRNYCQTN